MPHRGGGGVHHSSSVSHSQSSAVSHSRSSAVSHSRGSSTVHHRSGARTGGPLFHGPRTGPPVFHNPPHMRGHPGRGQQHRFNHIRRIDRGGFVPGFWFGPQFQISNWSMYGFSEPGDDERWVRYYDDAYLIGRDGRVRDGRYGMDWDRYGDDWDYDDNGVPIRAGDDDYERGDWDDDWADEDRRDGRRHDRRRGYGHHGPPMPPPGYGYGYGYGGYGYGYGWGWGPVIVTETIVTTAPVVETRVYYETVKVAPRKVRRCNCARPAPPRPRPGERG